MIIQAKIQNHELFDIKKNVVYLLMSLFPTYFVFIGIVFAFMSKGGDSESV
jgi:hypothetical protein